MKVLKLSESLNHKIETVWEVISDVSRTDWVPGVDEISLNGDIREFFMEGMGKIKEKILLCDLGGTHARFAECVKHGEYRNFKKSTL